MTNSNNTRNDRFGSDPTEGTDHPVGKSVGALAGALAGAAAASPAGPIGAAGGAAIGGIAGWLEGKTIAEAINPELEIEYWGNSYESRPYFKKVNNWNDYEPAYRLGIHSYNPENEYNDIEPDLESDWDEIRGDSKLSWTEAKYASRDAWNRISERNNRKR